MQVEEDDAVEPLLVIEGPEVRSPLRSWRFNAALVAWTIAGMLQHDLLQHAPWPHASGWPAQLAMLVVWSIAGVTCFTRWDAWRKRLGGRAVLFADRVFVKKDPQEPGARVRWTRLRGYTTHGGYVRLHLVRGGAPDDGGVADLAWTLVGAVFYTDDGPTLPAPTPEVAEALKAILARVGVPSLD